MSYYKQYFSSSLTIDVVTVSGSTSDLAYSLCDSSSSSVSTSVLYSQELTNQGRYVLDLSQDELTEIYNSNRSAKYALVLRSDGGGCMAYPSYLSVESGNLNKQTSTSKTSTTATTRTATTATVTESATPTYANSESRSDGDSNDNKLAIILGTVAGVLGLLALALLGALLYRRRRARQSSVNTASSPAFASFMDRSSGDKAGLSSVAVPNSSPIKLPHLASAQSSTLSNFELGPSTISVEHESDDEDNKPLSQIVKEKSIHSRKSSAGSSGDVKKQSATPDCDESANLNNGWTVGSKIDKYSNRNSFMVSNNQILSLLSRSSRGSLVVKPATRTSLQDSTENLAFSSSAAALISSGGSSDSGQAQGGSKDSVSSSPCHTLPTNLSALSSLSPHSISSATLNASSRSASKSSRGSQQLEGSQSFISPSFPSPSIFSDYSVVGKHSVDTENKSRGGGNSATLAEPPQTPSAEKDPLFKTTELKFNGPKGLVTSGAPQTPSPIDMPSPFFSLKDSSSNRSSGVWNAADLPDNENQLNWRQPPNLGDYCTVSNYKSNRNSFHAEEPNGTSSSSAVLQDREAKLCEALALPPGQSNSRMAHSQPSYVVIQPATFHPQHSTLHPVKPGQLPPHMQPQIIMIPQASRPSQSNRLSVLSTRSSLSSSASFNFERDWIDNCRSSTDLSRSSIILPWKDAKSTFSQANVSSANDPLNCFVVQPQIESRPPNSQKKMLLLQKEAAGLRSWSNSPPNAPLPTLVQPLTSKQASVVQRPIIKRDSLSILANRDNALSGSFQGSPLKKSLQYRTLDRESKGDNQGSPDFGESILSPQGNNMERFT